MMFLRNHREAIAAMDRNEGLLPSGPESADGDPKRGALAQGRIPFVLEADLQGQEACRETTDIEGGSGIDIPDGR